MQLKKVIYDFLPLPFIMSFCITYLIYFFHCFFTGFCVKTHKRNNGEKLFINICHCEAIPSPSDITEQNLIDLIEGGNPSGYKIPMSIGNPRPTKDKSGNDSSVIDVAIATQFFKKIENNPTSLFREFLLTIVFEGIEVKYGIAVDINSWSIMKNRKFVDTLAAHNIQNRDVKEAINYPGNASAENLKLLTEIENIERPQKKKLIEELNEIPAVEVKSVDDTKGKDKPYIPNPIKMAISQANTKKPDSRLFVYPPDKPAKILIAEFYLPLVDTAKEINLDVGEDRIIVEARKKGYMFDGFVDYLIDQDNVKVHFNTFNHKLRVKMSLKG